MENKFFLFLSVLFFSVFFSNASFAENALVSAQVNSFAENKTITSYIKDAADHTKPTTTTDTGAIYCSGVNSFLDCTRHIFKSMSSGTNEDKAVAMTGTDVSSLIRYQVMAFVKGTGNSHFVGLVITPFALALQSITKAIYSVLAGYLIHFFSFCFAISIIYKACSVFMGAQVIDVFFFDLFKKSFIFTVLLGFLDTSYGVSTFFSLVVNTSYNAINAVVVKSFSEFGIQCPSGVDNLTTLLSCTGALADDIVNPSLKFGMSYLFSAHIPFSFSSFSITTIMACIIAIFFGMIIIFMSVVFGAYVILKLLNPLFAMVLNFGFAPLGLFCLMFDITNFIFINQLKSFLAAFFLMMFQCVGIAVLFIAICKNPIGGHTAILDLINTATDKNLSGAFGLGFGENLGIAFIILLYLFFFSMFCSSIEKLALEIFDASHIVSIIPATLPDAVLSAPVNFVKEQALNLADKAPEYVRRFHSVKDQLKIKNLKKRVGSFDLKSLFSR